MTGMKLALRSHMKASEMVLNLGRRQFLLAPDPESEAAALIT